MKAKVLRKELLSEGVYRFDVDAPRLAKKTQPGQFIILRVNEEGERIPLTVADFDREKGVITIIFQVVGASTELLASLEEGDEILDFVGPLGKKSEIEPGLGTVVCIGGGIGVAPIHPIARGLHEAGNKVISILGARSKELIIMEKEMREANPDELLRLVGNLRHQLKATVMYYGPTPMAELEKLISKTMPRKKNIGKFAYEAHPYKQVETNEPKVLIAPYDAKNIYMIQYYNENIGWNPEHAAIIELFNNYFGGGMSGIVFQELREARGLAYSAFASYDEAWRKTAKEQFYTYIITQNDKMIDCVKEFNTLLDSMPQREATFANSKQYVMKNIASRRVQKFSILSNYHWAQRMGLDYDINSRIYKEIPGITLQQLAKFADERIARKPYTYIILGNEADLDMKTISSYGKVKRVSLEEAFGY